MIFDELARKGLHTRLCAQGYQGGEDELMDELRAQSYGAEVRLFCDSALQATLREHPAARKLMVSLCKQAQKRFSVATTSTWNLSSEASIVFGHAERRERENGEPLRLDGVALTAEIRAGKAQVRVQAYIENDLRRDISKYFTLPRKKGAAI